MRVFLTRWRALRLILALLLSISLVSAGLYLRSRPSYAFYHELTRLERESSRKWLSEVPGKQRYVKFRQLQGAGFNNQVCKTSIMERWAYTRFKAQEILLFHHLAQSVSRTYVYQPLVWRPRGEHSLVPLSAFLRGTTHNTISDAVFDDACPPAEISHVQIKQGLVSDLQLWSHAKDVLNGPARCIVVDDWILNWK
jgi:hypothetical protein